MSESESPRPLIAQRRFGPFFWTQAFGAFNDNVFKQALLILFTYQGAVLLGMGADRLNNLAALIFILPFFLFSAIAGQVAEKFEKAGLITRIKFFEIVVMCLAGVAFFLNSPGFLLLVLFLMGAQSTFFGPIKYAILPEVLTRNELVNGNGQISMATFVAILLGSLAGGALIAIPDIGWILVTTTVLIVAVAGYLTARGIPSVTATDPDLTIDLNLFRQSWQLIGYTRRNMVVFRSILGVSWFWFFGSVMLPQLPTLVKNHLMGDEMVAIGVLTLFSVGIGVGSMLCDKLSRRSIEIGLVPLGSIGLSLFGMDLYFAAQALEPVTTQVGVEAFLARDGAWRLVFDILLLGGFGGIYIVPLNALIQHRSEPRIRSRIIAGANLLNAGAMVIAGIYSIALLTRFSIFGITVDLTVLDLVFTTAILNAIVAIYIYSLVPEFLLRFITWIAVNTIYRMKVGDLEKIPDDGPALLVCNHLSYADALVIGGSIHRPTRFVMYHKIFRWPVLNYLFRTARAIPIAPAKEDPHLLEVAYQRIAEELRNGEVVCIFPEGRLSHDGEVAEFKRGVEKIVAETPVPVVPMGLQGLWGSFFSRSDGGVMRGPMRKLFGRITLNVGDAIAPQDVNAERLRQRVLELIAPENSDRPDRQ